MIVRYVQIISNMLSAMIASVPWSREKNPLKTIGISFHQRKPTNKEVAFEMLTLDYSLGDVLPKKIFSINMSLTFGFFISHRVKPT